MTKTAEALQVASAKAGRPLTDAQATHLFRWILDHSLEVSDEPTAADIAPFVASTIPAAPAETVEAIAERIAEFI